MSLNFSTPNDPRVIFTLPFRDGLKITCLPFEKHCYLHLPDIQPAADIKTELPEPESLYARVQNLSILPNNRCNFHCSYCYAAASKDNTQLNKEQLFQAVKTFFSLPERRNPTVSFLGGGEPLLSRELVMDTILFIRKISPEVPINIVTNGSVSSEELKSFLRQNNVSVTVSFEVLPDVQNSQRGNYALVHRTIRELISAGIKVKIRTILTDKNILRTGEMASVVKKEYAGISRWLLEPVSAWSYFDSAGEAMKFWQNYRSAVRELSNLPEMAEISWNSLLKRFFKSCGGVYCDGEFTVMPSGAIGLCHRISSPDDPLWDRWLWGSFDGRKYQLFPEKAQHFYDVPKRMKERCGQCPAFACCGGNCRVLTAQAEEEYIDRYCSFIRECYFEYLQDLCRSALQNTPLPSCRYLEVKL